MAIRKVLRMGHPLLRAVARPVTAAEIHDPAFGRLLADMHDTLADYRGVGLAAPQVGEGIRVAIVQIPAGAGRYGVNAEMPLTVFCNPVLTVLDPATAGYWEGCLSVPGLRGMVERPQAVRVDYLDREARPASIDLHGFAATVVQHEFDHLDGVLYVDRIADTRLLVFEEELDRFHGAAPQLD